MPNYRSLAARAARSLIGPLVPRRSTLRFRHRLALLEGGEPELRFLAKIGPNQGTAIDVGANEGLYTFALSRLYDSVHAFEINPDLAAWLSQRAPRNVSVHAIGLSSSDGEGELNIPLVKSKALTGWASLESDNCPDADNWIRCPVKFRPLDSLGLRGIRFIKADVEGHELQLLTGAADTIRRERPTVLLEVKQQSEESVRDYFTRLNYRVTNLQELTGVAGSPENFIFVPIPRVES